MSQYSRKYRTTILLHKWNTCEIFTIKRLSIKNTYPFSKIETASADRLRLR